MTADLHMHTTASDGHLSPGEILRQAIQAGLTHIAITDHDTVDGMLSLEQDELYRQHLITVIPGIEFSADLPGREVHILGYGIDPTHTRLHTILATIIEDRYERIQKMIKKVNALGYVVDFQDILHLTGKTTSLGRPHIAKALVKKGYFSNVGEVFSALLFTNGPAYVPHYKLDPEEIIAIVRECGGVPVIAHPALIGDDELVSDLIGRGIQGLEAYHPKHSQQDTQRYASMAQVHGLLVTGGSDFHAVSSRFPDRLGVFTINKSLAENLLQFQKSQSTILSHNDSGK